MSKTILKRLEYVNEAEGSSKFWQLEFAEGDFTAKATWGRIGRPPQGEKIYDAPEANKKLREKLAKGYQIVDGEISEQEGAIQRVTKKRTEKKSAIEFMVELRKIK